MRRKTKGKKEEGIGVDQIGWRRIVGGAVVTVSSAQIVLDKSTS